MTKAAESAGDFVEAVRKRVRAQFPCLDQEDEEAALRWIEAVSEFDNETWG